MLRNASSGCQPLMDFELNFEEDTEADMHADGRRQQEPADQQHEAERPCDKGDNPERICRGVSAVLQRCSQAPASALVQLMHDLVCQH